MSSKSVSHVVDVKNLLASPKKELMPLLTMLEDWKEVLWPSACHSARKAVPSIQSQYAERKITLRNRAPAG